MTMPRFALLLAAILATAAVGGTAVAADQQTANPTPHKPSADHERLDVLAGTWRFDKVTTMPGRPPERSTGVSENRWILGDRYLECRAREGEGAAASEHSLVYGFDLGRRTYFSLTMSSRGTSYRNLEGFYDEPARSLVLLGRDPGDGRAPGPKIRQVVRIDSPERHVLELFLVVPGRLPQKVTEITYTRQ